MKILDFLLVFIIFSVTGKFAIAVTDVSSKGGLSKGSKGGSSKVDSSKVGSSPEVPSKRALSKVGSSKEDSSKVGASKEGSIQEVPSKGTSRKEGPSKEVPSKGVSSKEGSSKGRSKKEDSSKEGSSKAGSIRRSLSKNARSFRRMLSGKALNKQESTNDDSASTAEVVVDQLRDIYDEAKKTEKFPQLDKDVKEFEEKNATAKRSVVEDATVSFYQEAKKLKTGKEVDAFRSELSCKIDEVINSDKRPDFYRIAKKELKQNIKALKNVGSGLKANRFWYYIAIIVAGFVVFGGCIYGGHWIIALVGLAVGALMLMWALFDYVKSECCGGGAAPAEAKE